MSLYNDVVQICDESSSPAHSSGAFKSLGGHCKDENLACLLKDNKSMPSIQEAFDYCSKCDNFHGWHKTEPLRASSIN